MNTESAYFNFESKSVLIKIKACGVCRTDLHIVDGELSKPKLPSKEKIIKMDHKVGKNLQGINLYF